MSIKEVVYNRKAKFLYHIKDTFEAGMVLVGSEVKSLRQGGCELKDAYVSFRKNQAYLQKAHISPYTLAGEQSHKPERLRKLLLHQKELAQIQSITKEKNMTCIPLRIYFKKGLAKVEIALAVGKTQGDKRETKKKRQDQLQIQRALKKKRSRSL